MKAYEAVKYHLNQAKSIVHHKGHEVFNLLNVIDIFLRVLRDFVMRLINSQLFFQIMDVLPTRCKSTVVHDVVL